MNLSYIETALSPVFNRSDHYRAKDAFTLIELLVVVSIIVLLISLLVPAMDRAIYNAELTMCATRQKGTMNAVTIYAGAFRRSYPYRPVVATSGPSPFGQLNYLTQTVTGNNIDDRIPLRPYMSINKSLTCPLAPKVDIDGSKLETVTWSQYELWFGFNYDKLPGMKKLGDTILADEYISKQQRRYNLLISDVTQVRLPVADYGMSEHRDSKDLWVQELYQDQPMPTASKLSATLGWYTGKANRGTLDLNYGYQDGAVIRVDKIAYQPVDNEGRNIDYIYNYKSPSTDNQRFIQVPTPK